MPPLPKRYEYSSTVRIASESCPGVEFTVRRMSVKRRGELARQALALQPRLEFLRAGSSAEEHLEAAGLAAELEELYLRWGLAGVEGLEIDGREADTEILIESGPEELCREIAQAVRRQCGLSEQERKN